MFKLHLGLTGKPVKSPPSLLNWQVVHERMPWNIVLLLGGGFAMAAASEVKTHEHFFFVVVILTLHVPLYIGLKEFVG